MSELQISLIAGEEAVTTKLCNALIDSAEPSVAFHLIPLPAGVAAAAGSRAGFELARHAFGGTWVGGRVTLTNLRIIFEPNALNTFLQNGISAIALPLEALTGVQTRWGFLTSIVEIEAGKASLSIRCFGAKQFAQAVDDVRVQAQLDSI